MVRLIKRYDSRKLYDTEESRYVSLEELATWIRDGQEVRVLDNSTSADVTAQTLTQIILDEGRSGTALPSDLLHDLVRLGERAVHSGVERVQKSVDTLVRKSVDRLAPVKRAREEMADLRTRLEDLEASLTGIEDGPVRRKAVTSRAAKKGAPRSARKKKSVA
ncbi:MAG: polyhydroxyalkanoate synthesis regulator DNA-binding domain-containing protein [Acidobacteriota bacterium]